MSFLSQRWARAITSVVATLFVLVTFSVAALAQTETGQISGKVTDPNGAAVAGAAVVAKNAGSGAERTATTNEEGGYIITNLQPGIYDVTATGTGFAPGTQRAQVTVGGRVTLDVPLAVTAIGGEVTVVAGEGGVEVNTQTQELADVVSSTQLRELPTITRNPYALVAISGNVSEGDTVNDAATLRGTGFNINGQRTSSTNILLDGGENVDNFGASVGQSIPLDAVGEFRVITSNFSAEYGRASGGIVNVSTRPGTNEFHGTVYEFNRVARLASNDFDNNARGFRKDPFVRNQFGYAVGGPIKRNKLFFFNSTEWTRVRSSASVARLIVAPEFLALVNPRTQAIFNGQSLVAQPTGRVLTLSQVRTSLGIGAGAFTTLAAANPNVPAFREVQQTFPTNAGAGDPQNTYSTTTRIDWNLSDKTQIYGRYALESQKFFEGSNANSPFAGFNTGTENFNQNALLNITHTFTPNFVSQTKLVYNRLNNLQPLAEMPPQPTYFFRNNTALTIGGVRIALPGYLPFSPGSAIPFGGPQNVGQVYEDINYTRGKHTFRFGGTYVYIQDNRTFGAYQNAVAAFGTNNTTTGFNNFVAGNLQQFQVAVDPQGNTRPGAQIRLPASLPSFSRSNRYNELAFYFNDSLRVAPNVTLNLGLRYEYYGIQHNKDPELDANFYFGSGDNILQQLRNGQPFRAEDSPVGALWRRDLNNFAPRLGFAWDVNGDGKTSVRGGYGLAYERNFGNVTFNVIQNPPATGIVSVVATATNPIPVTTNNLGPLAGTSGTAALPRPLNIRHVNENIRNAYAHFWSAALEREIAPRTVASVEYSGSAGKDLYDLTNANRAGSAAFFLGEPTLCLVDPVGCNPANPNSLLNADYFPLNTRGNKGRSTYHAMIASLESSNLRDLGLQFTARYTWARAKDNLSSTFSEGQNSINLGFLDPFDPELDYGFADFDVRHRFVGSFNWDTGSVFNFNNSDSGVVRNVLGGWTVTGIVNVRSGTPFSIFDCTNGFFFCNRLIPSGGLTFDVDENAPNGDDPNEFLLLNLNNQQGGVGSYINPIVGTADFGPYPANMTRRNAFRGPGFWNMDFGLYKNIRLGERYGIQLRSEFYNVFNHANMFLDGNSVLVDNCVTLDSNDNCTNFGIIGTKTGRRNIQLAIKFTF